MSEIITLEDFIKKFNEIKEMGWILTHRSGDTGIGKTLEDLLGISENNIQGPDFGVYELKAGRNKKSSMLTLVTKSPEPSCANGNLLRKFGYISPRSKDKTKKSLHATIKFEKDTVIFKTGNTLRPDYLENLETEHGPCEAITLISNYGIEPCYWPVDTIKDVINTKFANQLVYVLANSKGSKEREYFKFEEAYIFRGISGEKVIDLLERGIILIDIRIGQYADGTAHDHGTAFRIHPNNFHLLFDEIERIDN